MAVAFPHLEEKLDHTGEMIPKLSFPLDHNEHSGPVAHLAVLAKLSL
jgi:hypothetical protein